jgi:hypothetical protein
VRNEELAIAPCFFSSERKAFFFEKKKQKTSIYCPRHPVPTAAAEVA